jgi:hypothetical protein
VDDLYTAMRTFDDILNDEQNHIKLKMKPGDLVSLKNKAWNRNLSRARIFKRLWSPGIDSKE